MCWILLYQYTYIFRGLVGLTVISSKDEPLCSIILPSSIRNAIPFVTYASRVVLDVLLSRRMEYPTKDPFVPTAPADSPSSRETRVASEMADIRLGSVQ